MSLSTPIKQFANMHSPSGKPLKLLLTKTVEGIERRGVSTYETTVSFSELVEHFPIEANADTLPEELKRQRDVDPARVNGLKKYWAISEGPVLPGMIMFGCGIETVATHQIAGKTLMEAVLPASNDRFIADGQGRTSFIKFLLGTEQGQQFKDYTISFKLVVTNTADLLDEHASSVIRQLFSDLHCNLKKPSKSVSKLFDSSTPFARLQADVLNCHVGGVKLSRRIALHGKIRRGNVWTYEQLCSMLSKLLGNAPTQLNKDLADEAVYQSALSLCNQFLARIGAILPMEQLDCDNYLEMHEKLMFTKAIFCNALGYVGKSIIDEMVLDPALTWDALGTLALPILSKIDKYWQVNKVTLNDENRIKIIKGTDKRIASLICRELRVYPCEALAA
ncbi:MAG: hypothetical protein CML22_07170 [Rheinheimera sp.]|nr:hypothetical protein [Rheinheimera sp.]MBM34064.1 hypothetical protein [Rheinheimera sp.]|tara:strand:+ start:4080 stop:5255 length:1176 start_codon:yes stop_codon:yes gene_type:complete